MFWDSLVLSFYHNENLHGLQVDVTLTLRVDHYKFRVFLYFKFSHWKHFLFWKIGLGFFNLNIEHENKSKQMLQLNRNLYHI